jgi:VWFA-related protein
MSGSRGLRNVSAALIALAVTATTTHRASGQQTGNDQPSFRFRTAVELINVTATVTDPRGRFVSGLTQNDFTVYEDGDLQSVTHFGNERVPVSLGIVLDTSGSMEGDKIVSARRALERFLVDLLDPADEVFLYRFSDQPVLVEEWTSPRELSRALGQIRARGGTALYDAVAEAVPLAQSGRHRKKAVVIISDGNDTSSATDADELKDLIRETEVLVYAIGIDGRSEPRVTVGRPRLPVPLPIPFPVPGRRPPVAWPPGGGGPPSCGTASARGGDRVNVSALRDLTDDSGGRTEIIRDAFDLDPATAGIADELSKQYYLGYPARGLRDGRWHTIRVQVKNANYLVRHRRGYVATP